MALLLSTVERARNSNRQPEHTAYATASPPVGLPPCRPCAWLRLIRTTAAHHPHASALCSNQAQRSIGLAGAAPVPPVGERPSMSWRCLLVLVVLVSVPACKKSGRREIISLLEGDPGSGASFSVRWSKDSKAVFLTGDHSGFGCFHGTPTELRLIYTIADDKLWRVPQTVSLTDNGKR